MYDMLCFPYYCAVPVSRTAIFGQLLRSEIYGAFYKARKGRTARSSRHLRQYDFQNPTPGQLHDEEVHRYGWRKGEPNNFWGNEDCGGFGGSAMTKENALP